MIVLRIAADVLIGLALLAAVVGIRAVMPPRMRTTLTPGKLGLPSQPVVLRTSDGVVLKGWFIPSAEAADVVVCLHGYPANKSEMLAIASFLHPEYSLLLVDFRAHGESGGRMTTFGLRETRDVRAALDFARGRTGPGGRVVLYGFSMGAATAILAAAETRGAAAVVSDSSFARFDEMITHYFGYVGPLKYPLGFLARRMGSLLLWGDYSRNSPVLVVGDVRCPILFIHSAGDDFVPVSHARRLFERAREPKELWLMEGVHSGSLRFFGDDYRETIRRFLRRHLPRSGPAVRQQEG